MGYGKIATLAQVKIGSKMFETAAKLLKDQCPAIAAARAYYQAHHIAEHIALDVGPPLESVRDGKTTGELKHSDFRRAIVYIARTQIQRTQVLPGGMTLITAETYAEDLLKGRMEGDYRPYLPFSKDRAEKLILQAHALTLILIAEAEHRDQLRKQNAARAKQGTPP